MLGQFVIDYSRRKVRLEKRSASNPVGSKPIELPAMRTENIALLCLDDERLDWWNFGDLPPQFLSGLTFIKFAWQVLAFGDRRREDLIAIVQEGGLLLGVSSAVLSLWIRIGFLIQRWRPQNSVMSRAVAGTFPTPL